MLRGSSCSEYRGFPLLCHGQTALPAYRADLNYRVIPTEQDKPVSLPAKGRSTLRRIDGGAGIGIARKCDAKVSSTVLRGLGDRKVAWLLGSVLMLNVDFPEAGF